MLLIAWEKSEIVMLNDNHLCEFGAKCLVCSEFQPAVEVLDRLY